MGKLTQQTTNMKLKSIYRYFCFVF